ncbi:hypothetical protein G6011_08421 [Alternaria panax]|uniref:Mtf2-like C-terminal domain-containing protein n=1 Tax=Alternaria panax TaxID=48097 RepID=A0AAD4I8L8_9PLEO|nr:hypothetical protein G6011_08421 [Alternaria panax]
MSICSNSARALSRSRIPPSKTLLPFLYQTPTIQQWQSATRSIARRNITSPSRQYDREDIPFEDESLPPAIDQEPPRKTTITGTERAAFQKLYRKFNTEGRQQKDRDHAVELDQIADEYYEDEEDSSVPSLDKVFDQVLKGEPRLRASRTVPQRSRTRPQPTKEDALHAEPCKVRSGKRRGTNVDAAKFKEMRLAERERVDALIRNAPTDRALWQTLEREVFTKVRELDLDDVNNGSVKEPAPKVSSDTPNMSSKSKPAHKPDPPSADARALFQNYPLYLITAVSTLRTEFPSSPLPFSILPTIKRLGRSSYALGATITLYKHLIRTAWIQQSSYTTVNKLLTEMDDNAIEFDADILGLLDAIIKEHNQAKSGVLGREISLVYSMEMFVDGLQKIATWRDMIAERLGIKSEEKRASSTFVRRVVPLEQKAWREIGSERKAADTQRRRGHSSDSTSNHMPLVEGANPGVGASPAESIPEKDGERTVSLE